MKKSLLLLTVVLCSFFAKAQFPSKDSAHRFNNKYIRNIPVDAFHQLRLNTMIHYLIDGASGTGGGSLPPSDTTGQIPHGHNGKGNPGGIRFNDTLYVFQVSKDTVWVTVLLETANGLTKSLDTVLWGGTLDRETEIDQSTNGITFHDGIFKHGWGDYINQGSFFNILSNEETTFGSHISDGSGDHFSAINNIYGTDPLVYLQASKEPFVNSELQVRGTELRLHNTQGNYFIDNLIDSAQSYSVHYNPTNGKLTYSALGGGGGISGVTADRGLHVSSITNVRWGGILDSIVDIDQSGNGIIFHGSEFIHGTGDYNNQASAYTRTESNSQFFSSSLWDGSNAASTFLNTISGGAPQFDVQVTDNSGNTSQFNVGGTASAINIFPYSGKLFIHDLIDSAQSYSLHYNPTNHKVTYSLNGGGGGGGGGGLSLNSANGLSNRNDSTVVLGGSLDQQTTIDGGASYSLTVTGSRASGQSTFTGSNSSTGAGITGSNSSTGVGIKASSVSGTALEATSSTLPGSFQVNDAATTSYAIPAAFIHGTSGTAGTNFGLKIPFNLETSDGSFATATNLYTRWTNATTATRTSRLELTTINSGIEETKLALTGAGQAIYPKYGIGTFAGTYSYLLGVSSTGEQVEIDPADLGGTGSGLTSVSHDATLTGSGTSGSPLKVDTTQIATINDVAAKDGSETIVNQGTGITVSGSGTAGDPYVVTATGGAGTNPMAAISIEDYGATEGVTIGGGNYATGTSNTAALNSAIAAADDGQWVVIPSGDYLFSTAADTIKGPKKVNILFIGNVYTAGNDLLRIKNNSGAYEQHKVIFWGNIVGRINMPSHTKTTHDNGTGPDWSAFAGVPVKLINVNQSEIWFNKVEGTKAPIEFISGGGNGGQENIVHFRYFYNNAHGILMTSTDGSSWQDKNVIGDGVSSRISGGLALKIDGYSGTASNGEKYNGAFRSNEFHFLAENIDSVAVCDGDITEPLFDITIEGGTATGWLNDTSVFRMRSVAPNYVRAPRYTGRGIYYVQRLGTGSTGTMGINGTIEVPIWNSGTYLGKRADIDNSGNIVIECQNSLSQTARSAAGSYVKFKNEELIKATTTTTASSYSLAANDYVLLCNAAGSGTVTVNMPSADSYPDREVFVRNISTGGTVVVSGGDPTATDNIAAGQGGIHYKSVSGSWRVLSKWHD